MPHVSQVIRDALSIHYGPHPGPLVVGVDRPEDKSVRNSA